MRLHLSKIHGSSADDSWANPWTGLRIVNLGTFRIHWTYVRPGTFGNDQPIFVYEIFLVKTRFVPMQKVFFLKLFLKWVTWSDYDSLECCGINYSRYTDVNESPSSLRRGFFFFVSDLLREILQYIVEIFKISRPVTWSSKIFENSTRNVIHYEGCPKTNSFENILISLKSKNWEFWSETIEALISFDKTFGEL